MTHVAACGHSQIARRSSLPLLKRARIEVYLPDKRSGVYKRLGRAIEQEFLFTFGGCTVIRDIKGLYLNSGQRRETDKITLVYADMPFELNRNITLISEYADAVRDACSEALPEQSVLVVVHEVMHSI
jgi:hypothetical protein